MNTVSCPSFLSETTLTLSSTPYYCVNTVHKSCELTKVSRNCFLILYHSKTVMDEHPRCMVQYLEMTKWQCKTG